MLCIPQQFAFPGTQLIVNVWYCVPRLVWIGCKEKSAIIRRVNHGWAVRSIGNMLIIPFVFSEAMACESFYRAASGHLLYDSSILVVVLVSSLLLWSQGAHL